MPNGENAGSADREQDKSKNQLNRVKQLTTMSDDGPDGQSKLEQLLLEEMKRVDSEFDKLNIDCEYTLYHSSFEKVVNCFDNNLELLTQMMYVVGESGKDQMMVCISNYIKGRIQQVEKNFPGIERDAGNLSLLPLVSAVTGYGLGLLNSNQLQMFHKFFTTTTVAQNSESNLRIVDYLLSHVWEGRNIRLWKYHIPEGSIQPSQSLSDAQNILLTRMAFLEYLNDKLKTWLHGELNSMKEFGSQMSNYKILGSLIYLERFSESDIKGRFYNDGELDYTVFKFEHNLDFFDGEVSSIDKILTKDYINKLKEGGFKVGESNLLKLFKQFYVEVHFLTQYWSDANKNISEPQSKPSLKI